MFARVTEVNGFDIRVVGVRYVGSCGEWMDNGLVFPSIQSVPRWSGLQVKPGDIVAISESERGFEAFATHYRSHF